MSIRVPGDTLLVLETLTLEAKSVLSSLSLANRMLLTGAVIDAENLIAEIKADAKSRGEKL